MSYVINLQDKQDKHFQKMCEPVQLLPMCRHTHTHTLQTFQHNNRKEVLPNQITHGLNILQKRYGCWTLIKDTRGKGIIMNCSLPYVDDEPTKIWFRNMHVCKRVRIANTNIKDVSLSISVEARLYFKTFILIMCQRNLISNPDLNDHK